MADLNRQCKANYCHDRVRDDDCQGHCLRKVDLIVEVTG